ncbi:hypothetical protein ACO03_03055 [Pantoea ananatis]|nr:hypothetical protein ACO03_03055 [Pantoea ananatis]
MSTLEKINALMLCDIIKHLKVNTTINPEIVEYAINSGNLWVLDAEYSLFGQHEPSRDVRVFVAKVLNMYRGLSLAYRNLSNDERTALQNKVSFKTHNNYIQIPGFDGNNEYEYFSVVEAYHYLNRYPEQQAPIEDTHYPTINSYQKMSEAYESLDPWSRSNKLTFDETYEVLSKAPAAF